MLSTRIVFDRRGQAEKDKKEINESEVPEIKTESINTDVEYSVQQKRAVDDKVWWVVIAHSNLTDKYSIEGKFKTKKSPKRSSFIR